MARWWQRRRQAEARQVQWPYDVGPPAWALGGPTSVDAALSLAPVYAAVTLLADAVASLPLQIYRDMGDRQVRVPSSQLFDAPAPGQTLYDWVYSCMTSLLLWGNAYGLVTSRDGFEYPTSIVWLRPSKMRCEDDNDSPSGCEYYYDGREIPAEQIFHVRAATLPGCSKGISPLEQFAGLISSSSSAQQYGADWFQAGGFPPGVMRNTAATLNDKESEAIKAKTVRAIRTREPLVVGADWEYKPISVPPEQAQFIETMQMNATQVAAVYRVPPERIGGSRAGGSLTYANQSQDEIAFQNTSVRPWCTKLEHAFFGLLPNRQYTRFNMDAAIRVDLKTRHEVFEIDRRIGFANIDELRAVDDLAPLPGGAGQDYTPLAAKAAAPAPADAPPAPTPAALPPARPRAVS